MALGDSVTSNESEGITVEVGEKVIFFVNGEKMPTLRAMVVMTLDSTCGCCAIVEKVILHETKHSISGGRFQTKILVP